MKVGELIERLQKLDGTREVILASDSEGNSYYSLSMIDANAVAVAEGYGYMVFIEKLDKHLKDLGYTSEDVYNGDDGNLAVVFYP